MVMAQALPRTDCSGWAAMPSPASAIELAELLADQVFLHLAHGVARQLLDKEHPLGVFELGELIGKSVQHIAFCQGGVLRSHNTGGHAFAEVAMRQANYRRLDHTRQFIDQTFDFLGIDIEAATDDQVLVAPQNMDITLVVDAADIPGDEETVG